MERKGAAYRITATKAGGGDPAPRVLSYPWKNNEAYDDDTRVQMSVQSHPAGGHTAQVTREDDNNPESAAADKYIAGPFRNPTRAKMAAEALGNRVVAGGANKNYRGRNYG